VDQQLPHDKSAAIAAYSRGTHENPMVNRSSETHPAGSQRIGRLFIIDAPARRNPFPVSAVPDLPGWQAWKKSAHDDGDSASKTMRQAARAKSLEKAIRPASSAGHGAVRPAG
jgi:hypothetical protein